MRQVSHCYLRATVPGWPYGLYTMIHGRGREDCAMAIDEIAAVTGPRDRAELWTKKQYKKRRIKLFTDLETEWAARV